MRKLSQTRGGSPDVRERRGTKCAARYGTNRVTCLLIGKRRKSTGRKLSVDIALLKFCKQLHRFQFLVRLHEKTGRPAAVSRRCSAPQQSAECGTNRAPHDCA